MADAGRDSPAWCLDLKEAGLTARNINAEVRPGPQLPEFYLAVQQHVLAEAAPRPRQQRRNRLADLLFPLGNDICVPPYWPELAGN
jgi:hypothetical protein